SCAARAANSITLPRRGGRPQRSCLRSGWGDYTIASPPSPHSARFALTLPCMEGVPRAEPSLPFCRNYCSLFSPYLAGNGRRLVGSVEKLHRDEVEIARADVLEVVYLVVAFLVGLVPRLAGLVAVLDRGAVVEVGARPAVGRDRPEIVEHVTVKAETFARL